MTQPIAVDLYCGLGGWTEGLMSEGWDVIGFDIERHVYEHDGKVHRYPAQLVLQDVRTLHGSQFRHARLFVASSPCQKYSYMAMPWTRAKEQAKWYRDPDHPERLAELNDLFEQPERIRREASEAAGRHIPLVQENVCGAQKWVGRARWHYGSYYLWGDVPALMPATLPRPKVATMGAGWYPPDHPKHVPGLAFNTHAERATKNGGGSWFNVAHNTTSGHGQNPDGRKIDSRSSHPKGGWFYDNEERNELRRNSSQSRARKMASAQIAKIPFALASHIARVYYPDEYRVGAA